MDFAGGNDRDDETSSLIGVINVNDGIFQNGDSVKFENIYLSVPAKPPIILIKSTCAFIITSPFTKPLLLITIPFLIDMTLEVPPKQNLLIMGPSGTYLLVAWLCNSIFLNLVSRLWEELYFAPIKRAVAFPKRFVVLHSSHPLIRKRTLKNLTIHNACTGKIIRPRPSNRDMARPREIYENRASDIIEEIEFAQTTENISDRKSTGIFYVPQKSYVFPGTLVEQIIYPQYESGEPHNDLISENEIRNLLEMVNLGHIFERYQSHLYTKRVNWEVILSPGEQQRIAMARLFFHRPIFAILDEATSSVEEKIERKFYKLCKQMGITLISVGHRTSLLRFHSFLLRFERNSVDASHLNWKLTSIE